MSIDTSMDMLKYKELIEEGDLVIVYLSIRNLYPITMKRGEVFQNKYGALKHDDVIGKKFGSVVNCSRGWVYVLFPTPELWTITLPHRTQILYSTDISLITLQLDLKPGSVVCEAGTGSGSLTHAIARTISPDGCLYTFDFHEQRVEIAQKEFESHGLNKVVKVDHRDVSECGFGVANVADAVFLDLPQPWDVVPFIKDAMKLAGGRVCSFSPCIEQVQRTCVALQSNGFKDISTIECIQRQFDVKRVTLPTFKMHTSNKVENEVTINPTNAMEVDAVTENSSLANSNQKSVMRDSFWTALPPFQTPGHTGYLTFATLSCRSDLICEKQNKTES